MNHTAKNEDGVVQHKKYATVFDDEGIDYRLISIAMSNAGWKMNHTSVRNYVLRAMMKFAEAYAEKFDIVLTQQAIQSIAKDVRFQSAISDMLQNVFFEQPDI